MAAKEGAVINGTNRYAVADPDASTWAIFSQIIGLTNELKSEYSIKHDRSLTSVLSANKLIPLKAGYCFPNRQNIDKLIRGELVGDNEIVRKMLIFLTFYTYWARIIISQNGACYLAKPADSKRCFDTINNRLYYAGYPELYAGNPYDWLLMMRPRLRLSDTIWERFLLRGKRKKITEVDFCADKTNCQKPCTIIKSHDKRR